VSGAFCETAVGAKSEESAMARTASVPVVMMLAVVAAASGCASMQTTEWTGHRIDEVIAKLGPPDVFVHSAEGGKWTAFTIRHGIQEVNPGDVSNLVPPPVAAPAGDESIYFWRQMKQTLERMFAAFEDSIPGNYPWVYLEWAFVVGPDGAIRRWAMEGPK
jgi:hypothetical protein